MLKRKFKGRDNRRPRVCYLATRASDRFNVALNDLPGSLHKLEDVAALATQHGVDTILVPGDVSSEADVEKMVDVTVNRFGGLDAVG